MKRMLALFGIVVILGIVCASQGVLAETSGEDVLICHVSRNFERPNGIVFATGRIIEIDSDSLADHQVHGDVAVVGLFAGGDVGCPCTFSVLPNGNIVPGQVD